MQLLHCFLLSLLAVHARVSVSPDGSITISSAQSSVHIVGDLLVAGTSISSEVQALQNCVSNANQLALYSLPALRYQSFITTTPRGASFFTASNNTYLVVSDIIPANQQLYQWDPASSTFLPPTTFTIAGGVNHITTVVMNGTLYLLDSNNAANSALRPWNGTGFASSGLVITTTPAITYDWGFVQIGSDYYLGQATDSAASKLIYKLTGTTFTPISLPIQTGTANDWEFISINSKWYAVITYSTTTSSVILTFNSGSWSQLTTFPTTTAYDSEWFQFEGNTYLVVAEARLIGGSTYSEVFKWTGSTFASISTFPTQGARDVELINLGNELYAYVSNMNDGTTFTTPSQLFKWNKKLLTFELISSANNNLLNRVAKHAKIDEKDYLFAASATTSYSYELGIA